MNKLQEAIEDLKMLNGIPPHNNEGNMLYGDWCFANSLEEKYSKEILEQAEKSLEGVKGSMPDNMD